MESIQKITKIRALPIVTTYTISSLDIDFEKLVHDGEMLFERFREFQLASGYDTLMIMGDGTYIAEAFGCDMTYEKREPFITSTLPIETEEQAAAVAIPEVECCGRIRALFDAIRMAKKTVGDNVPIITNSPAAFTSTARILGMNETYMNLVMKPDMVKIIIDKVAEYTRNYTDAVIEAGADMIFLADPAASTNLLSPAMFREFAVAAIKQQVEAASVPAMLHICGKVLPIATDMADVGAAMLSIDQDVEVAEIRKTVGNDVVIGGNMDPHQVVAKKSVAEVREKAHENFRDGGENFVLVPGCTIVPNTPMENVRAMCEVASEMAA